MKEQDIKTQPTKQNGVNTWKRKGGVEKQRRLLVKVIRDLGNEDLNLSAKSEKGGEERERKGEDRGGESGAL